MNLVKKTAFQSIKSGFSAREKDDVFCRPKKDFLHTEISREDGEESEARKSNDFKPQNPQKQ